MNKKNLNDNFIIFRMVAKQLMDKFGADIKPEIFIIEINSSDVYKITSRVYSKLCDKFKVIIKECFDITNKIQKVPSKEYKIFIKKIRARIKNDDSYKAELVKQIRNQAFKKLIKTKFKTSIFFKNFITYCSDIISFRKTKFLIFLIIPEAFHSHHCHLHKDISYSPYYILPNSLVDSAISFFLKECVRIFKEMENISILDLLYKGVNEFTRLAGESLMNRISFSINDQISNDFYESINIISTYKYEKSYCNGKFLITHKNNDLINYLIQFNKPIDINDYRIIRKLLEISSDNAFLICDTKFVYGIGNFIGKYNPQDENLYTIEIINDSKWILQHDNNTLMHVEYGQPFLPKPIIDKAIFEKKIKIIFNGITEQKINNLFKLLTSATNQKKGTIIVISSEAKKEANRLKSQSLLAKPFILTNEAVNKITSIDGAVLIDDNCICYSIGVILDGKATKNKGTNSRGARYNSAIKYYENKKNCLIAVISEDGMIDLI